MTMKSVYILALAGITAVAGCAGGPVGIDATSQEYGVAGRSAELRQIAYGQSEERLRDLSRDFKANVKDTVTFAFNSAALDASARQALDGQAEWLKKHPTVRMTLVGHTDLVGSERYNQRLGLRRARTALNYLVRKGVSRKRLLAVESRGEREPVVQTEDRERRNRRSITFVSGFGPGYVGTGLDGEYSALVFDRYQAGSIGVEDASSDTVN